MMFNRHAAAALTEAPTRTSGSTALKSDEVSRFGVRLVVVDRDTHTNYVTAFARLPQLLRAGDVVVVNDAATLPAALPGRTAAGLVFELRLSAPIDGSRL